MTRDCTDIDSELADSPDLEDNESTGYESDLQQSKDKGGESDKDKDKWDSEELEDDDDPNQFEMEEEEEEEEECLSF